MAHTEEDPQIIELIADGGDPISEIDVGEVQVWNDEVFLYVTYIIDEPGWVITQTHLHVADALEDIPAVAHGKNAGSPIPGLFDYIGYHDGVTEVTYTIPITWDVGTELYIAAHAKVIKPIEDCWEQVWQIGDVEAVSTDIYCDEFNYAGFYTGGPWDSGPFANPFIVGTTPTIQFPWISLVVPPLGQIMFVCMKRIWMHGDTPLMLHL